MAKPAHAANAADNSPELDYAGLDKRFCELLTQATMLFMEEAGLPYRSGEGDGTFFLKLRCAQSGTHAANIVLDERERRGMETGPTLDHVVVKVDDLLSALRQQPTRGALHKINKTLDGLLDTYGQRRHGQEGRA